VSAVILNRITALVSPRCRARGINPYGGGSGLVAAGRNDAAAPCALPNRPFLLPQLYLNREQNRASGGLNGAGNGRGHVGERAFEEALWWLISAQSGLRSHFR